MGFKVKFLTLAAGLTCAFFAGCGAAAQGGHGFSPFKFLDLSGRHPQIHALLINGGDSPRRNYQSHLLHIKEVVRYLLANDLPKRNIAIFASDGMSPEPDLAVRRAQPERDFWLIRGLALGGLLQTEIRYENSAVEGLLVHPATKKELKRWFATEGTRLHRGDTLFVYVTDHGSKNKEDLTNNSIVLWGEKLSVKEFKKLLAMLPQGVRVVSLMSQCFSGSFANASFDQKLEREPDGRVCGYFSSTADRFAYGCYPENRGKNNIGHSFRFIEAMRLLGSFPEANCRVLITDRTPDVPNRSSDLYVLRLLEREAARRGQKLEAYIDELLKEAWEEKERFEPEIRLLDRIGETFGSFSPRSLAELESQAKDLPELSQTLRTYADRWKAALRDLKGENLVRFLDANPSWKERLQPKRLKDLEPREKRMLTRSLLMDLVQFTNKDYATRLRLESLKKKAREAGQASYRMAVRLGVVLRMRSVLTSIAGRVYLENYAPGGEKRGFERLTSCEDLSLGPVENATAGKLPPPISFPPLAEEVALVKRVLPGWMGIRFRQVSQEKREELGLLRGAVAVLTVYPDSPAQSAGLEVGDIILGPPRAHFEERNEIREWTMTSSIDKISKLEVLRDSQPMVVSLRVGKFPVSLPPLPGPPKVGSVAPPLKVELFRGELPELGSGRAQLLFFWATWCGICKAAVPELLALEKAKGIQIVAITDEPKARLDKFFKKFDKPFPYTVVIDELRQAFLAYGVSGTPTFVLIDEDGKVAFYATGYSLNKGLEIPGWKSGLSQE